MAEYEYMLRNYLLNELIRKLVPFGQGQEIFGDFMLYILHYAMIKLHLIGISSNRKRKLSAPEVVDFISGYVRAIDHNISNSINLFKVLKASDNLNTTCMAILINE